MEDFEYWLIKSTYWFVYSVLAVPIWLLLFWVAPWIRRTASAPMGLLSLVVIIGIMWLSHYLAAKSARHQIAGGGFYDSLIAGLAEFRAELSTLPVVGRFFGPRMFRSKD